MQRDGVEDKGEVGQKARDPTQRNVLLHLAIFPTAIEFGGAVSFSTVTPFDLLETVNRHPFDVPSPIAVKLAPGVAWRAINDGLRSRDNNRMGILSVALSTSSERPTRQKSFGFSSIADRQKIQ